ncbi:ABC transporter permease subunit [Pelagibius sp.]|uniref:ABC transporter permease subunit n=1 Tax=Pelagibius sp. TaxID=1931238 RepID=UPI003C7A07D3
MDFSPIFENYPLFLEGLVNTTKLVVSALAIGLLIAVPLAILRTSRNPLVNGPVWAFTYFFRGTPLLVQIFMIYYGLGQLQFVIELSQDWTFLRDAYWYALLAFTLNTAAYTTEIIRGAIEGTPYGEVEAARACGMSKSQTYAG